MSQVAWLLKPPVIHDFFRALQAWSSIVAGQSLQLGPLDQRLREQRDPRNHTLVPGGGSTLVKMAVEKENIYLQEINIYQIYFKYIQVLSNKIVNDI